MNQPWYIHAMYTIIKPFLKDKTRKRVRTCTDSFTSSFLPFSSPHLIPFFFFLFPLNLSPSYFISRPPLTPLHPFSSSPQIFLHGNNLNSLHQLIQPECLPSEFGGTLPPYDMGVWARTLLGPDYNDEAEYTLTYDALHVRENCGGGGDKEVMKR